MDELGAIGVVEFRDLNPEVNILQRKFINEVVRCAEMERKLKFVMKEINRAGIKVSGTTGCESTRCSPRRGSSVGRASFKGPGSQCNSTDESWVRTPAAA